MPAYLYPEKLMYLYPIAASVKGPAAPGCVQSHQIVTPVLPRTK